jgi:predicted PurR-regulated permease PerM
MESAKSVGAVVWRAGLHALALAILAYVAYRGLFFLKLAAVAVVLAAAAETPVRALTRRGWKRLVAVIAVVGAAVALVVGLLAFVLPNLARQAEDLVGRAPELLEQLRTSQAFEWLQRHAGGVGQLSELATRSAPSAADLLLGAASGAVGAVTGVFTVVALTAFVLVSGPRLWRGALAWVHPERRGHVAQLGRRVRSAVAGYTAGVLAVATIAATVTGTTMLILGVPYALPLAVATGLLGIVPYVGAILAGILVVSTTFLTAGQTAGWIAAVVFFAYQQAEGALLAPLIQRRAIQLDPLIVLFGLLLGIGALGVWGGVMALPLLAAAKVVARDALERRHERWRRRSSDEGPARVRDGGVRAPPARAAEHPRPAQPRDERH